MWTNKTTTGNLGCVEKRSKIDCLPVEMNSSSAWLVQKQHRNRKWWDIWFTSQKTQNWKKNVLIENFTHVFGSSTISQQNRTIIFRSYLDFSDFCHVHVLSASGKLILITKISEILCYRWPCVMRSLNINSRLCFDCWRPSNWNRKCLNSVFVRRVRTVENSKTFNFFQFCRRDKIL